MASSRDPEEDWLFAPDIAALDRKIRREMRGEAEALEADVKEADLRERDFSDIASEMRNRGDFVTIATSRRSFNGYLVFAAGDLVTVRTETFEVDINLRDVAYIKVVTKGSGRGGTPSVGGPGTFEMRLMERRSPLERVELGYCNIDDTVIGRIVAVGQDHVILIDQTRQEWAIATHTVSWVIRRGRSDR